MVNVKIMNTNKKILKSQLSVALVGGLLLSSAHAQSVFDGQKIKVTTDFHSEIIKELHSHSSHAKNMQKHFAGHYADPRALRHIGSGGHKLTANDFKNNAWNYYLASA